jgi:hypothetical protein
MTISRRIPPLTVEGGLLAASTALDTELAWGVRIKCRLGILALPGANCIRSPDDLDCKRHNFALTNGRDERAYAKDAVNFFPLEGLGINLDYFALAWPTIEQIKGRLRNFEMGRSSSNKKPRIARGVIFDDSIDGLV